MTIIPERRRDTDVVALFLAGVCLLVAWRGAENAPVIAGVFAAVGAVIIGGWIYLRRTPRFALTIGPDEIVFGRPNQPRSVIASSATAGLLINYDGTTWSLVGDGPTGKTTISLFGFDPGAVANACEANGWPVTMNPPLDR